MEEKKKHGWFRHKKGKRPPHHSTSSPHAEGHHAGAHHSQEKHFGGKKLRIIPLGGLEEVGKNIMALEYGNDIVVIDAGMSFAGPDMLGVDFIVPDISYLEARKHKIRGILFTHGHLDHIGAIQYVLPKMGNPPIYANKLALGLIKNRLKEFSLGKSQNIAIDSSGLKLSFSGSITVFLIVWAFI